MSTIHNTWLVERPIAHRGLHNNDTVPENSLKSFSLCIDKNIPIELDVRVTKDKQIVVFHDDKLSRMTEIDGYVNNLNYDQIKDAKLLKTNERIPLFSEVLSLVQGKVPILIEIKNINGVNFEKELWELLKDYSGEYAIQSFNPLILEWFKLNAPSVKRGLLASYFEGEKGLSFVTKYFLKRLKFAKRCEPNFISYKLQDLPNKYVKRLKDTPVICWTVKTPEDVERAQKVAQNYIFQDLY